ncbi:hypothetical protein, partial [Rhodoblastus sp.]|uniref:hypothetical protein n=1 Tax=Rhodoblastus sp. TaxID=1962975 RepID=UPI003F965F49
KIYPALMSGRPYVSLFHASSSAHNILTKSGGGRPFAFDSPAKLPGLVAPLRDALVELAVVPLSFGHAESKSYAAYTADSVAGDFVKIFDVLTGC